MDCHKKALSQFIDENEDELLEAYKEAFIYEETSHPKINWEGLPTCDTSFSEWVDENHAQEIEFIEEVLKQEELDEQNCAKDEYREQIKDDYKLAQTGKY